MRTKKLYLLLISMLLFCTVGNGAGCTPQTSDSEEEKAFKPLNHILDMTDIGVGAFHETYFYYFSEGSLKRVGLSENAQSETVL